MDHYGEGCVHHAKQEDMETFDWLTEFKKLVKAKLALPPLEEMRMAFKKKIRLWRSFNLDRPGEKIYSSRLPKAPWLAKAGRLKGLQTMISTDGVKSVSVKTNDGRTILHFAACGGHTQICDFLISQLYFDVNSKDSMGHTPLHEAAFGNHFDTLKYLVRCGADWNARAFMGLTALHFAVEGGNCSATIRYLVSCGIDVNVKSDFGTPLWMAAIQNQQEAMKLLLSLNADAKISPDGMLSPLHASILNCSFECVNALLLAGADPNIKSCGVSPLEAAIKCGDKMIVQKLLSEGAIPSGNVITRGKSEEVYSLYKSVGQKAYDARKYHTSFVWYTKEAVARLEEIQNYNESKLILPSFEEIRMLIQAKVAVIRSSNSNPETPDRSTIQKFVDVTESGDLGELKLVISKLDPISVSLLLNVRTRVKHTILHIAASAGHTHICEYIVESLKFDINIKDSRGWTPLHMAVSTDEINTVSWLICHHADLNAMTFLGKTALHLAAEAGNYELTKLLILEGCDVNASTDLGTPLCRAAMHNYEETMLLLLSNGAKPNEFQEGTRSPLCEAIMSQSYECIKHLFSAKADPNIKSLEASPLETAILDGNIRILELLLEEGANVNERDIYDLMPLELAVLEEHEEMAKILFPKTLRIPNIKDWSLDGLKKHYEDEEVNKQMILKGENAYSLYNSKGQEAYKAGRFVAGINWYTKAIDTNKCDQASVHLKRSLCLLQLNEYGEAMSDAIASESLGGESVSAEATCLYGLACVILKDIERGADLIEKVTREKLQSDPGIDEC